MVLDVVHEHVQERLMEALDLAIGLWVVLERVQVPDAHQVTHTLEEQGGELGSVGRQDCVRGPIHGNPIPAERRRDVRRGDASQGDGSDQLREPVHDDQEKDVPGLGLCQGSEEVHRQAREGVHRRKNLGIAVRRLGAILFLAQDAQLATQSYTSAAMDSQ